MANQKHLAILKQGVEVWNKWRQENPGIKPDLINAELLGAKLRGADLSKVDLRLADLRGAKLANADLRFADLSGAKLTNADLRFADLRLADLSAAILREAELLEARLGEVKLINAELIGAKLGGADLSKADLRFADLRGADLSGVILLGADISQMEVASTIFANIDLSSIKGLETVGHGGPSSIGIDTIYRSKGKIPEVFLRGAGVPDNFIEYMHSLTGETLQFYSCFISYSSKDQEFAERLYDALQAKGVRCWFAPHDVQGGKKLHEQIDQAILIYDKLLLILSEDSMNSEWVKTEIANTRQREMKEQRQMLFPVTLVPFDRIREWKAFDADVGKDSAREVREYFIPDFSNWKDHDSYQKAFDRLLRDLKAEGNNKAESADS